MNRHRHGKTTLPVLGQISEEIREFFFNFVLGVLDLFPVIGGRVDEEKEGQTKEIEEDGGVNLERTGFNGWPEPEGFVVHVRGDAVLIVDGHVKGDRLQELSLLRGHENQFIPRVGWNTEHEQLLFAGVSRVVFEFENVTARSSNRHGVVVGARGFNGVIQPQGLQHGRPTRRGFGYPGDIEVLSAFGNHGPLFAFPCDAVGLILENGAGLVCRVGWLLVGLEIFPRWVSKFILCGRPAVEIGEHRFAVGGGHESRVRNPKQAAAKAENDGKEENDVQPCQGRVVFGQVQIDDDFLFLSCQPFPPSTSLAPYCWSTRGWRRRCESSE